MTEQICDIHIHLVPMADDGSASMEMSLSMLYEAYQQGVRSVFATPHSSAFDDPGNGVMARLSALREQAAVYFPEMKLYPGCEVRCDFYQMDGIRRALTAGKYPSLNGSRYVLAEFSPWDTGEHAESCMQALIGDGWIPVIAHAERYAWLRGCHDRVEALRQMGCRIQINASSLAQEEEPIRSWARALVQREQADFLGSDAHNTGSRPPRLEGGAAWIRENCRPVYAEGLIRENAQNELIRPVCSFMAGNRKEKTP